MCRGYCSFIVIIAVKAADFSGFNIMHMLNRRPLRALLLFAGLVLLVPLQAADLARQRSLYQAAEQALAAGDRSVLVAQDKALQTYPLYPYLLYTDLTQRLADSPADDVRAFLSEFAATPLAPRLRERWLKQLAARQQWQDFLRDFGATQDVELDCLRRQALLQTGQQQQALNGIESIWLSAYSRPDACDPVFAVWRQQGGYTQARIWHRFELSMQAGQTGLARYLRGLLRGRQQQLADLWLAVHARPELVLDRAQFARLDEITARIVLHGLTRWSSRDSVEAAAAFDRLQQLLQFPPSAELDALQQRLALFVASRGDPSAVRRLAELPPRLVNEAVDEWRVRTALQRGDWAGVLHWTEAMQLATREQLAWRYWRARALEQRGQTAAANTLYQALAQQRDYYGFLAADRAGLDYTIRNVPTAADKTRIAQLQDSATARRARELLYWQRNPDARLEWRLLLADADRETLRAAAQLAHNWGWHDRAIATLALANDWDDLALRFPLPHRALVERYAREHSLNPAWVYAIMRKESIFQQDIRSSAGAIGLMQIMPATGQKIASELKAAWRGPYTLLAGDTNIRFGTYYLRAGMERFENNPILASAAYNAGPHRVQNWLPTDSTPADIWVELIPFSETRDYVKRVLEYTVVYAHRLGQTLSLRSLMPPP